MCGCVCVGGVCGGGVCVGGWVCGCVCVCVCVCVCLSLNDVKIRCERACESLALSHNGIVMTWM